MYLFPFEHFELVSRFSVSDLAERLRLKVEPEFRFRLSHEHLPYEGWVSETAFRIRRVIHYSNTFVPVICGRFERRGDQTQISVRMFPGVYACVVLFFWTCVFGLCMFGAMMLPVDDVASMYRWTAPGLIAFAWVVALICFWTEARRAKRFVIDVLAGRRNQGMLA